MCVLTYRSLRVFSSNLHSALCWVPCVRSAHWKLHLHYKRGSISLHTHVCFKSTVVNRLHGGSLCFLLPCVFIFCFFLRFSLNFLWKRGGGGNFYNYTSELSEQGYNARKVNQLRIHFVHIETSSLSADFVNNNRCISVRLVSEEVKSIKFW